MKKPATHVQLFALAVLIVLGGYLVVAAPVITRWQWSYSFLSADGRIAVVYSGSALFDTTATGPDHEELASVDLETGEVRIVSLPARQVRIRVDDANNIYLLASFSSSPDALRGQLQPTRLTTIDSAWQSIEASSEFPFPNLSSFLVIGNRFLVGYQEDQITVVDSKNINREIQTIAVSGDLNCLSEVPRSNRFYHVNVVTPQGPISAANPIVRMLELYQVDDQGGPRQLASWPVSAGGSKYDMYVDCNEHHIFSLSPDLTRIEAHSTVDGKLESTFEIPRAFDPTTGTWAFVFSVISMESSEGHRFFDLLRREWLPQPKGDYRLFRLSKDREELYCCDDGPPRTFKVYDRTPDTMRENQSGNATNREPHLIGEYRVDRGASLHRLDSDRFVLLSDRYGFSAYLIDGVSGKTIRAIKPLGWVLPLFIAVMLGYTAWCISWMITSARRGGWAWVDVLLVGGVPLLMMVGRMVMRGHALELSRFPVRFALGGAMAGAMLAAVWVVYGKTRLSLRGTPIWIFTAFLLALLGVVFAEGTWIVWHAVICAIVPAICLMLPMGLLRWLGFGLHQDRMESKTEQAVNPSPSGQRAVTLRDLFLMTVVASLLFAASRPIRDSTGHIFQMGFLKLPLLYAVMLGSTALVMALNRRGWVFWISVVGVAGGVVFLSRESLVFFMDGRSGSRLIPDPTPVPALASCAIALFVYLIPYRLRGWRLGRAIEPGACESSQGRNVRLC